MPDKRAKQPKFGRNIPEGQHVVRGADPNFYLTQMPLFRFGRRDRQHPRWGWQRLSADEFLERVMGKLEGFQTMTWAEIMTAAGGRNAGTNSHEVLVENLCPEAQRRLQELQILEDSLFSLRLQGTHRIYGVREGRILYIIWLDEQHESYPVGR